MIRRSKKTTPPQEPAEPATGIDALSQEVRILHRELAILRHHRMFVLYQSVPRILFYRLLTGMAVGLGTVIGATFLLSIIVWILSQIEFLPIIGEWASEIARSIEETLNAIE